MADSYDDTVRIRVLPESALQPDVQQDAGDEAPERGFDPYSNDVGAPRAQPGRRRTLDDMRRLSEAILRNRRAVK
jgi:hypothetical protein